MPIVNRDLLVDRPTITDPVIGADDEDDEEAEELENAETQVIGDGGGKTVHGLEFEEGQEEVIKASNLVAMLASGTDEPNEVFKGTFQNAAIQLQQVDDSEHSISEIAETADQLNASSIGVVWEEEDVESENEVTEGEQQEDNGKEASGEE